MTDFATRPRIDANPIALVAGLADFGSAPALVTPRGVLTYRELHGRVLEASDSLPSARSLILIEGANRVETIVAYLGALAGGHVVALAPSTASAAIEEVFDPSVAIRDGASSPEVRHDREVEMHPDLALLLTTSGSTGSPKLVRLSHANLDANARAIATYLQLTQRDRGVTSLPMHYCYGLSVLHSHLAVGASVAVTDLSVTEPCFWTSFSDLGVTGLAGVPHTFDLLDATGFADRELSALRYVTQAGGRLDPAAVRRHAQLGQRRGWDLYVMYGQTEATARMAYLPPDLATRFPDSIGVAIPGGSFRIVDPDPTGAGELAYRGPNVMLGYATGVADLAGGTTLDELRTGDIATQTPDGLVRVVGRKSRFLKLFGLRIDLDTVELRVREAGYSEVACTGSDTRLVCACHCNDLEAEQLRQMLTTRFGLPQSALTVVGLDKVPRLANGKPDYRAVDALCPEAPRSHSAGDVRTILASVTQRPLDVVTGDATFVSLGGDSLSYVEVTARLEPILGTLPSGWHLLTVSALESLERPHHEGQTVRRRLAQVARVETNVLLRAVGMMLIVGSHTHVFDVQGSAHILLAVAGYNFARFGLASRSGPAHLRRTGRIIARIAVPTWLWLAFQFTYAEPFSWPRALLSNNYAGTGLWEYWYIEAIVQLLLVASLPFAFAGMRALERRRPFPFALVVLGSAVAIRWARADLGYDDLLYRPDTVLWLFAFGWAAQRASTVWQRGFVLVLGSLGAYHYFDSTDRTAVAAAGLLALVLVSHVCVPRILARPIAVVASASLGLFLVQWAFVPLADSWSPTAAFALACASGISATETLRRLARGWRVHVPGRYSNRTSTSAAPESATAWFETRRISDPDAPSHRQ